MVSRTELSLRCSIQRESCVTGAKAISVSPAGSGARSASLRTKRARAGPAGSPPSTGFQRVAGERAASNATFLGPTRLSSRGASALRQLAAAMLRSAGVSSTCASFAASAKVEVVTCGPAPGAAPKVGGAPGGGGVVDATAFGCSLRHAAAAARMPRGARMRNCRRVFTVSGPRLMGGRGYCARKREAP